MAIIMAVVVQTKCLRGREGGREGERERGGREGERDGEREREGGREGGEERGGGREGGRGRGREGGEERGGGREGGRGSEGREREGGIYSTSWFIRSKFILPQAQDEVQHQRRVQMPRGRSTVLESTDNTS